MSKFGKLDGSLIGDHRRQWGDCLYVYPVISRRSRGLSVGINLNPSKNCTFSCAYCQVNRGIRRGLADVDINTIAAELELVLRNAREGGLWLADRFVDTPAEFRRINDIAFSGDGEPTLYTAFDRVAEAVARVKKDLSLDDVKIVLITNSTMLASPQVTRSLPILDANNGEIWAKLDAGSEEYFQRVNRPAAGITLEKIVKDIASIAQEREIVIQTLLLKFAGQAASCAEIDEYVGRLMDILAAGGKIKLLQLHTIARSPTDSSTSWLTDEELEDVGGKIRSQISPIPVEIYAGKDAPPQKNSDNSDN